MNALLPAVRRWRLWYGVNCGSPRTSWGIAHVRVRNQSNLPIKACWAYISLAFTDSDVIDPRDGHPGTPDLLAYITPQIAREGILTEDTPDRLHWAIGGNPPFVDICPGECQNLCVAQGVDVRGTRTLAILTENARENRNESRLRYRVFLNGNKRYSGTFTFFSESMPPKSFRFHLWLENLSPRIHVDNVIARGCMQQAILDADS